MDQSQLSENVMPTMAVLLSSVFVAWLMIDWMSHRSKKGVWGLPCVGQLLNLGDASHRAIYAWTKKYGHGMWLRVGFKTFLVLSNMEQIRELTRKHASSVETKPVTTTGKATKVGAHYDVVPGRWKKRKTIMMRAMKYVQKQRVFSISDIAAEEIRLMVNYLEGRANEINATALKQGSNPGMQLFEGVGYYMARLMYRITFGTAAIELMGINNKLRNISCSIAVYPVTAGPLGIFDVLPFWKFIKWGQYHEFCSFHALVGEVCELGITRYLVQEDKDIHSDSCVASHIFHLANVMTSEAKAEINLTDEVLSVGVCDVFRAGVESMTVAMYWTVLYMSAFPEIQEKVRTEVDDKISDNYDNAHKLPYLQAVMHEVYRFSSLTPFAKRTVSDSLTLADGTFIPKGTSVLLNLWALSRDPNVWNEPYKFNPDNFLKPDGSFDGSKVEKMMPFGYGMRRCPGEGSFKVLMPMLTAALMSNFVIEPPSGVTPDLEPLFGISLSPKPYKVVLKPRH